MTIGLRFYQEIGIHVGVQGYEYSMSFLDAGDDLDAWLVDIQVNWFREKAPT
jgi:hypothetical protein